MKGTYFVLIVTVIGLLLTACNDQSLESIKPYPETHLSLAENADSEGDNEVEANVSEYNDAPATVYTLIEADEGIQRVFPPGTLTIEHFLEDIDSMMYILENNFALLEVAYWAWGVDAWVLADNARADVLAAYEYSNLCEDRYLAILWTNFFPLFNTGHFVIFNPMAYHNMLTGNFYGRYSTPAVRMNNRLLESPLALRFYEVRVEDRLQNHDEFRPILREIASEATDIYNRFLGSLYDNVMGNWQAPDVNVTTKTIEEGRIGYISIRNFMPPDAATQNAEQNQIFDFFREIRDYEHLILDLRGNTGGAIGHFVNTILRPNLENTVNIGSFHFFTDGEHIKRLGDYIFTRTASNGNLVIPTSYSPTFEILQRYYFEDSHSLDFDRLQYGVASGSGNIHPNTSPFGFEPAFQGKIWMLTDNRMISAAQLAAWISMETGFATHVGETTGGGAGGLRTLALLPNTGIAIYFDVFYITDERGRPLEAGTIPHHFNREGMDALETVLALIAEGEY